MGGFQLFQAASPAFSSSGSLASPWVTSWITLSISWTSMSLLNSVSKVQPPHFVTRFGSIPATARVFRPPPPGILVTVMVINIRVASAVAAWRGLVSRHHDFQPQARLLEQLHGAAGPRAP